MKASATHIRISPRKVRMVVDTVRGKSVSQAFSILGFTRKKAALQVPKASQIRGGECSGQWWYK